MSSELKISSKKKHKIIILKGRNAQKEINCTSKMKNYKYRLEKSITDSESKIVIIDVKKK